MGSLGKVSGCGHMLVPRFEDNIGGGITLLNTRMRVTRHSTMEFLRNTAVFGAGIAMDDRCLVSLHASIL